MLNIPVIQKIDTKDFKAVDVKHYRGIMVEGTKGFVIALEGTDGSGKATQAELLKEHFEKEGLKVRLISLPRYESVPGQLIRKYLDGNTELKEAPIEYVALLYALDRYALLPEIRKELENGTIIIFDRYYHSNLAHQSARFEKPNDQDEMLKWIKIVESRLPKPDKKIFLDLPVEVTQSLMERRDKDIHENNEPYLNRTREMFRKIVNSEKDWIHINCATQKQDEKWIPKTREEIHEEIWTQLKGFFGVKKQ